MSIKSPEDPRYSTGVAVAFFGVHKWYGKFHALRNINLTVERGERIVICGPSGSGKSTLIRCVNGLEDHQRGAIVVDGVELKRNVRSCLLYTSPSPRD